MNTSLQIRKYLSKTVTISFDKILHFSVASHMCKEITIANMFIDIQVQTDTIYLDLQGRSCNFTE